MPGKSTLLIAALALGLIAPPLAAPQAALAQTTAPDAPRVQALADLIGMDAIFDVMAQEGATYGTDIATGMFPGGDSARWQKAVAAIYDPARMAQRFDAAFVDALGLDPQALSAAETFFGSPLGQRILTLELDARRVLLDKAAEEAASVAAQKMQEARDPRLRLIRKLIEAGDLVEMNVAGALTASLAFSQGMFDAGPPGEVPMADMMADVWAQESAVRADAGAWLISYMALAYASLSEAELKTYIAFAESDEGGRVNAALFAAFDAVFTPISRELGRAAIRHSRSDDI